MAYHARTPGALVADILIDTLFDTPPLDPARRARIDEEPDWRHGSGSAEPARRLRFSTGALGIDVLVTDVGSCLSVQVSINPPQPAQVQMRCGSGSSVTRADGSGTIRFTLTSQLVSFLVRLPGEPPVQTAWVRL